jgi:HlyD family secretion protein
MVYEGEITLDPTDTPLRAGMTATAIITTEALENALVLPNQYIQLDRDTGEAFVYKMSGSEPVRQQVRLGLRNERSSQILDGLTDGDTVAIVTENSEDQLRGTLFGDE